MQNKYFKNALKLLSTLIFVVVESITKRSSKQKKYNFATKNLSGFEKKKAG